MSNRKNETTESSIERRQTDGDDPLASTDQVISQEIPPGADRRTFLMRSAVIGATAVITGCHISSQERADRSTAPPPNALPTPLSADLNVVRSKNSNVCRPTPQNEGVRLTSPLGEADGRRDTREPLPRSHILEADRPLALAGDLPDSTRCSWDPPDAANPGMTGPASPQSLFG